MLVLYKKWKTEGKPDGYYFWVSSPVTVVVVVQVAFAGVGCLVEQPMVCSESFDLWYVDMLPIVLT